MSALDALLIEHRAFCDYIYCTVGDSARAELAQLRADLQAEQERSAEQARQLDEARELIDLSEFFIMHKMSDDEFADFAVKHGRPHQVQILRDDLRAWLAANPAPEEEPQP